MIGVMSVSRLLSHFLFQDYLFFWYVSTYVGRDWNKNSKQFFG